MKLAVAVVVGLFSVAIPSASQVTLRSVTRLVQVTVIAQDAQGHPVTGLGRDDFLVFDNGQRREIKVFTVDRGDRGHAAVAVEPRDDPSEHVFTNTERERSGPNGVTVILLDSLNTKWTDQARATRNVIRFLAQINP